MDKLSVILPCRNEAATLGNLFSRLLASTTDLDLEIIVVDDASSDNLVETVQIFRAKNESINIVQVSNDSQLGIYRSWKKGIAAASGNYILLMDGDLQNPPESISSMLSTIHETGADLVQGIRRVIDEDYNQTIRWAHRQNLLVRILFNLPCKDATSGFLLGNSAAVKKLFANKKRFFLGQSLLRVFAHLESLEVKEIETLFDRHENFGNAKNRHGLKLVEMLKFASDLIFLRLNSLKRQTFSLAGVKANFQSDLPPLRRFFLWLYFKTSMLHKWIIRSSVQEKYMWLKTVEFCDKGQLEDIQLYRLKELIKHSFFNVPYYRAQMKKLGLTYNYIKSLDDIRMFPLLSKSDVRNNIHFQMFANTHDKSTMHRIKTSGSTGEPFVCYADKFQLEMRLASTLRAFEMTGWRYGDKQLRLWHQTLGMSKSQVLKEKIDALFMRRKFVPAFEMTEAALEKLQVLIKRRRPALIDGYAESLNFLALKPFDYGAYSPKGLMSSAQQLTTETRSKIEKSFNSQVYDKYGSREFSGIAYQCSLSPYHHVQDESYIVEILVEGRPAIPGEIGEIVITDLNNFSVPLIRYRIGDMAYAVKQEKCKCGRSQTLIGNIVGRTQALVACANGVWLPGTFFAHFFKDFNWCIKHYQVYQEMFGKIELRIVPNGTFLESTGEKIIELMSKYVGPTTKVTIQIVDSIPLLITGKRTPVISKVQMDFQNLNSTSIGKSNS